MSESIGIQIGDEFDTDGFEHVKVVDIFISPTTQERIYAIEDKEGWIYHVTGVELQ